MAFSTIVALAASALLQPVLAGHPPVCPLGPRAPLSCHNTTAIKNTCCTEVGGQVLQVQFWDTNPATGPADHWTIHGLWPDFCDGTYTQYCDETRQYSNISCILEAYHRYGLLHTMEKFWKDNSGNDESFWEHEWNKHGTCYSTLNPTCYTDYKPQEEVVDFFTKTVDLFEQLPTYDYLAHAGIYPTATRNYTNEEIMCALREARGVNATIECDDNNALYEVYYTFNVKGSVADGVFVPENPVGEGNGCPDTGIQYLPKNLTSVPKVTPTTCPGVSAEPTATSS